MLRVSLTSRSLAYAVVILATLLSLLPTIYMADMSLRGSVQSFNPVLISPHPSLHNYAKVIVQPHLLGSFLNSVIVSLSSVLLTVVFGLLASFALSRLRVVFGTAALLLILSALMLPLAALLVPLTVLLRVLGLTNNYFGLIGPYTALGIPFAVVVLKGAMDALPKELEEAAVVDGATPLRVLARVIVPIIFPSVLVVVVWQFLFCWNEFFLALVVMTQNQVKTLPLIPLYYEGPFMTNRGQLFAILTILSMVPMIVYALVQRWFVSGLMAGSLKG